MSNPPKPGLTRICKVTTGVALLALLPGAVVACDRPDPFDREAAITRTIERTGGRLLRPQAECYVDRVVKELGEPALDPDVAAGPEQIERLTVIRVDCIGVPNIGVSGTSTTRPPDPHDTSARREPMRLGDDPQLDTLYLSCQSGTGASCDRLFDLAPPGSEYEEFALTCGGRTKEPSCAEAYPGIEGLTASTDRSSPGGPQPSGSR